jgi:hypothetical protein
MNLNAVAVAKDVGGTVDSRESACPTSTVVSLR